MAANTEKLLEHRGGGVVDRDGEKMGKLHEIYLDQETDKPEWALVDTGLFGKKSTFVPLKGAKTAGDDLKLAFDKRTVKDAPRIDADQELSQREEAELYAYYGLDYSESRSDTGLPEGSPPARGDDAMTRSEEELAVGKQTREAGRVRLKKYVVTENVTKTVPVQREEVRVEREPITDANVDDATSGPEISEDEHEVTLREEHVVVGKQTVPKERVRLEKDAVTEEKQISEDVRKEQIEVEDDKH